MIERRVEDPVDRRRRHAARAQDGGGLVGRREDGDAAPPLGAPVVVWRDGLDTGGAQRRDEPGEEAGLAGARAPDHRHGAALAGRVGQAVSRGEVYAGRAQA
jgi:hypothetical protein